jgi:hypothetical protein
VPGAFDASAEFGHDPLPTAEEIQHSGQNVLRWLEEVATSEAPWAVDVRLVQEIHFRWFETTFPADAGRFRAQMVLNRKGSAVEVEAILPAVTRATWHLRNYLLMLDGLRPLLDLANLMAYESAWWNATAEDHARVDAVVLDELALQEPPA